MINAETRLNERYNAIYTFVLPPGFRAYVALLCVSTLSAMGHNVECKNSTELCSKFRNEL